MMLEGSALLGLFVAAFVAATPVPFQSEIIFAGLLAAEPGRFWVILLVASVANVLGSLLTYGLGRGAVALPLPERFRISQTTLDRAAGWYGRWGVWSLLLSWAPLGDALTFAAGVMRTPVWLFLLLVGVAKTGRYAVLGAVVLGLFG
ncbi:YqaA family protein [Tabrizicola sp. M-4]|uniref:YqaA family protein n=1 Tax=Tabrizicola sp. M-4 TaxID=3055847 RepID=UPI003DA93B97